MIKITIFAYGRLKEYFPEKTDLAVSENSSLKDILITFSRSSEDGGSLIFDCSGHLRRNLIVQLNQKRVLNSSIHSVLPKDGDEIIIYPPVSGG
ncbi:MoaD/ThiS family protein [Methanolapillus ohkumae]